jgi:hypothetical protein
MAYYRFTILTNAYNQSLQMGYSEHYDFQFSGDTQAVNFAPQIAAARRLQLSNGFQIIGCRVASLVAYNFPAKGSKAAHWGLKSRTIQACPLQTNNRGNLGQPAAFPGDAVLVRFNYTGSQTKPGNRLFRGVPSTWIGNVAPFFLQSTADACIQQFGSFLKNQGCLQIQVNASNGALTNYPLGCLTTLRLGRRDIGRPFIVLLRGRKFAHRS